MADYPAGISHRGRISGVSHWRWQRYSAIVVLVLMTYFTSLLATIGSLDFAGATALVAAPHNAVALAVLLVVGLFHGATGLQVVLEDYVSLAAGRVIYVMMAKILMTIIGLAGLWALVKIAL